MSEHNLIYSQNDEKVGHFRFGVAWSTPDRIRLGEYDDEFVYDNESNVVAKINNGVVMNIIGEEIGMIAGKNIFVNGKVVGKFLGTSSAAAASIALIFNVEGTRGV
jgi:hypothetical protein